MAATPHSLSGLRCIRQYKRVPVADLAKVIGVADGSYLRFENGSRRLYFDKAIMLAKALGVSIDALITHHSEDELFQMLGPSAAQVITEDSTVVASVAALEGWEPGE